MNTEFMNWHPEPMACLDVRGGQPTIKVVYDTGQEDFSVESTVKQCLVRILPWGDIVQMGASVREALAEVTVKLNQDLIDTGTVCDTLDWDLVIEVRARAKAWPAVEGITTPYPEDL